MIGKKASLKKYRKQLPGELLKRYGGAPYTEAQVTTTVRDLGLSQKHIHYAYLLYCNEEVLEDHGILGAKLQSMLSSLSSAGGEYATYPGDHNFNDFSSSFDGGDGGGGE